MKKKFALLMLLATCLMLPGCRQGNATIYEYESGVYEAYVDALEKFEAANSYEIETFLSVTADGDVSPRNIIQTTVKFRILENGNVEMKRQGKSFLIHETSPSQEDIYTQYYKDGYLYTHQYLATAGSEERHNETKTAIAMSLVEVTDYMLADYHIEQAFILGQTRTDNDLFFYIDQNKKAEPQKEAMIRAGGEWTIEYLESRQNCTLDAQGNIARIENQTIEKETESGTIYTLHYVHDIKQIGDITIPFPEDLDTYTIEESS